MTGAVAVDSLVVLQGTSQQADSDVRTTMDLDLSEEQRELETSVRDVLDREQSVELARRVVEEQRGRGKGGRRAVDQDGGARLAGA